MPKSVSQAEALRLLESTNELKLSYEVLQRASDALGASSGALKQANAEPLSSAGHPDSSQRLALLMNKLEKTAKAINLVTDSLNDQVVQIDAALKNLSLGVEAWITFESEDDGESGYIYKEKLGYCKIGTRWCITISTDESDLGNPENSSNSIWPFSQAPRDLRIKAADHIPSLLEAVADQAEETVQQLARTVAGVKKLSASFTISKGGR